MSESGNVSIYWFQQFKVLGYTTMHTKYSFQLPPNQMVLNSDVMQMSPSGIPENIPMMQGPPPDSILGTPPPGFGPPGTQGWTNDEFGKCDYLFL